MSKRAIRELDCSMIATEWPTWKQEFIMYLIATGKFSVPEKTKIANFLWLVGRKGSQIYNTLYPNDGTQDSMLGTTTVNGDVQQRKIEQVLKKFDYFCLRQRNTAMESYKFNMIAQKERQPFSEFETELREQVRHCNFICECGKSYEDRILRDRVIIGVQDKKLQLKLLDGRGEQLSKVTETCKAYEVANIHKGILEGKQVITIIKEDEATINAINRVCFNCRGPWKFGHKDECKAKDITCHRCEKKGHFQRMCRKQKNQQHEAKIAFEKKNKNGVTMVGAGNRQQQGTKIDGYGDKLKFNKNHFRINSIGLKHKRWTKEYQIGEKKVRFKLDCGSDVKCVQLKLLEDLKKSTNLKFNIKPHEFSVFDYNGNRINIHGKVKLPCYNLKLKTERSINFVIKADSCEPILGLETCEMLGLIKRLDVNSIEDQDRKRDSAIELYKDVLNGIGKFPGSFKIQLIKDAKPVLHYKKRIPSSLTDKLKAELDTMLQDDIISRVDYPTDWVNNLQIIEKPNGKLRICLDSKSLNACIKREHFLIPTIDDLTSK